MPLVVENGLRKNTEIQSTTSRTTLDRALIWELSPECNRFPRLFSGLSRVLAGDLRDQLRRRGDELRERKADQAARSHACRAA